MIYANGIHFTLHWLRLWLIASAALISSSAPAETLFSEPSPKALQLAGLLRPSPDPDKEIGQAAAVIAYNLLRTSVAPYGPGCDPGLAACKQIAEELAWSRSEQEFRRERALRVRIVAIVLEGELPPDKIEETLEFMRTDAGAAVVKILELTNNQSRWPAKTRARMAALTQDNWRDPMSGLFQDFYKRTKDLPRREVPVGPRPPQMAPGPLAPISRPNATGAVQ